MTTPPRLGTVAVVGNGLIGHGVAQVFAAAGHDVRLIGRSAESLGRAGLRIRDSLAQFVAHGLVPADAVERIARRVRTSTTLADAGGADLVVEAVPEDMSVKEAIFGELDRVCPPPAVLASSSGHPVSHLAARVRARERIVAAHFWNPPQLIPLVEVCAAPETAPDVVPWVCEELRAVGKTPVILDRELDGFLGNRLQFALLREALALWAAGVASPEAIDLAVTASFGRRLAVTGPLASADLGGLDVFRAFSEFLFPLLDRSPAPPEALARRVREGHRGLATGQGIFDWSRRDGPALLAARIDGLFRHLASSASAPSRPPATGGAGPPDTGDVSARRHPGERRE